MATPLTTGDPGRSRGPVSLESRTNPSDDQGRDKVNRPLGDTPSETSIARESRCSLPHEIVEMIIAYLTHDLDTLKACSLTCRSWYVAAVPHLHHTLTLWTGARDKNRRELKPLSKLHELGLAPLVKEVLVAQLYPEAWFVPQAFSPDDLHHFSAFVNVQALVLYRLNIGRFVPGVEQYFGHFSPTLLSIHLTAPCCTPRQLSYFLSFFPNLDDVSISSPNKLSHTTIPDSELVPFSAPKLRGRLELYETDWVETWTDLITSCGGLRFTHMDLRWVGGCVPFLLGACAETLETLECSLVDSSSLLPGFDLSRLKVLRSLRIGDWLARVDVENRHTWVMEIFSTITSSVFSELVIAVRGYETSDISSDVTFFEALRTMKEIRPFKLVFSFDTLAQITHGEKEQRRLAEVLDMVNAAGLLDFLDSPFIIR